MIIIFFLKMKIHQFIKAPELVTGRDYDKRLINIRFWNAANLILETRKGKSYAYKSRQQNNKYIKL